MISFLWCSSRHGVDLNKCTMYIHDAEFHIRVGDLDRVCSGAWPLSWPHTIWEASWWHFLVLVSGWIWKRSVYSILPTNMGENILDCLVWPWEMAKLAKTANSLNQTANNPRKIESSGRGLQIDYYSLQKVHILYVTFLPEKRLPCKSQNVTKSYSNSYELQKWCSRYYSRDSRFVPEYDANDMTISQGYKSKSHCRTELTDKGRIEYHLELIPRGKPNVTHSTHTISKALMRYPPLDTL